MISINMTAKAWMKMQTLISGWDKEVGWYGTAEKVDHQTYRITDILLFPQYTSGTYIDDVKDDPLEITRWEQSLTDEQYNSRRFFGHSHVNMGVSPSGTDTDMCRRFANSCVAAVDNRFCMTVIINKKAEMNWWLYDADTNIEYKNSDIEFAIEIEDGLTCADYYEDSKELVKELRSYTHTFLLGCSKTPTKLAGSYILSEKEEKKNNTSLPKVKEESADKWDDDFDDWIKQYTSYMNDDYDVDNFNEKEFSVIIGDNKSVVKEEEIIKDSEHDFVCYDLDGNKYGFICDAVNDKSANKMLDNDSVAMTIYDHCLGSEITTFCLFNDAGYYDWLDSEQKVKDTFELKVEDTEVVSIEKENILYITVKSEVKNEHK